MIRLDKFFYYSHNFLRLLVPLAWYRQSLARKLATIKKGDVKAILDRVNYYNQLHQLTPIGDKAQALKDFAVLAHSKSYSFDLYEHTRYFNDAFTINFLFGDVIHTERHPTVQKSRPIAADNANAVLLKLDKTRHFVFVKDRFNFSQKRNELIGRGTVKQEHRIRFYEKYFDHPLCNLGQINKEKGNRAWLKPKLSREAHLAYKFILSLEGNDVASNLKWVMASRSIAVMPRPKYESWFMEGRLVPDYHYVQLADDYSDLEEKLAYYSRNEEAARAIVTNANAYVQPFLDKEREDLIALLVLDKYFYYTGQSERSVWQKLSNDVAL